MGDVEQVPTPAPNKLRQGNLGLVRKSLISRLIFTWRWGCVRDPVEEEGRRWDGKHVCITYVIYVSHVLICDTILYIKIISSGS